MQSNGAQSVCSSCYTLQVQLAELLGGLNTMQTNARHPRPILPPAAVAKESLFIFVVLSAADTLTTIVHRPAPPPPAPCWGQWGAASLACQVLRAPASVLLDYITIHKATCTNAQSYIAATTKRIRAPKARKFSALHSGAVQTRSSLSQSVVLAGGCAAVTRQLLVWIHC